MINSEPTIKHKFVEELGGIGTFIYLLCINENEGTILRACV